MTRKESKEALKNAGTAVDMKEVLVAIFERCKTPFHIKLTDAADDLYTEFYDDAMNFRKENKFENCNVSVKSKSKGLSLRIAGIISLLRNAVNDEDIPSNQEEMQTEVCIGMKIWNSFK